MGIKTKYLRATVVTFICIIAGCFFVMNNLLSPKQDTLCCEVYTVPGGYGYSISYKDKILIVQNFIPVIGSQHPFKTYKDAEKIGNLVCEKMMRGDSPTLTYEDLKISNIQIPDVVP